MKKAVKIFGGLLLVLLFCGAVMMYFNTYHTNEEEETEKKEVSVKVPKTTFELKEDAEIGDFILNVSEAELTEDYEKIDAYYKNREYILSSDEYIKAYVDTSQYNDLFPGDVRFLRVKYLVTNNGDAKLDFSPEDSICIATVTNGQTNPCQFRAFDSRGASENGKEEIEFGGKKVCRNDSESEKITKQIYSLSPGETIEVESVGEFHIFDQYSMYATDKIDAVNDNYDFYLMKTSFVQRIHLGIEGSFGNGTDAYAKVRDIQKMKYESWTNLERKEWMEKWEEELEWSAGTKINSSTKEIVESSEPGQRFVDIFYEGILEAGGEAVYGFCLETILDNFQITEWKDVPAVYTEQGNLQKMAERYQNVYGCKEEELKVLLLDLSYVSSEIGELESYQKRAVNYFYGRSNIYTKDEEKEELYWFGQADDWTVLSDSKHPENTGPVNLINMELEEVITVQMAYILPPALYEQCDALYFTGGRYALTYHDEIVPITRIALK